VSAPVGKSERKGIGAGQRDVLARLNVEHHGGAGSERKRGVLLVAAEIETDDVGVQVLFRVGQLVKPAQNLVAAQDKVGHAAAGDLRVEVVDVRHVPQAELILSVPQKQTWGLVAAKNLAVEQAVVVWAERESGHIFKGHPGRIIPIRAHQSADRLGRPLTRGPAGDLPLVDHDEQRSACRVRRPSIRPVRDDLPLLRPIAGNDPQVPHRARGQGGGGLAPIEGHPGGPVQRDEPDIADIAAGDQLDSLGRSAGLQAPRREQEAKK
jgi:hypothetical protein